MPTLKIHKKSRFQPNEEIFAESCLVRYKDLFRAKKILGVIGTLNHNRPAKVIVMKYFVLFLTDLTR